MTPHVYLCLAIYVFGVALGSFLWGRLDNGYGNRDYLWPLLLWPLLLVLSAAVGPFFALFYLGTWLRERAEEGKAAK